MSSIFSSSLQQHLKGRLQCDDVKYSSKRQILNELFDISHAPIHAQVACYQGALNRTSREIDSVAEVRVSALFQPMVTRVSPNPAAL